MLTSQHSESIWTVLGYEGAHQCFQQTAQCSQWASQVSGCSELLYIEHTSHSRTCIIDDFNHLHMNLHIETAPHNKNTYADNIRILIRILILYAVELLFLKGHFT